MDNQPLHAQRVQHWTIGQLFEKEVQEIKRRMGLPSKIVEADTSHAQTADNEKRVTDDQPTRFITSETKEK